MCVCFRQLGLDLVPRQEFSMVDPDEISVTELYRLVSVLHILSPLAGCGGGGGGEGGGLQLLA